MRQSGFDVDALADVAERLLPGSGRPRVERTPTGGSTPVYRIARDGTTLYLRLAEDAEDDPFSEALVHNLLRARGVRVPEVVHVEAFNPRLGRGLMVTSEIAGIPLSQDWRDVDIGQVLRAAGRDLALINDIGVDGFGWVRRDRPNADRLEAELPSLHRFVFDEIESHLAALPIFYTYDEIRLIHRAIRLWDGLLDADRGLLAHGDFDTVHIYHRDGAYSGIIDFGEIRGTDRYYDLGHFALYDGERFPGLALPHLLAGYDEVFPLPPDHEYRVRLWSLLIGIRALARTVGREHAVEAQRHLLRAIKNAVVVLP
ncbi:MAG TPA: aminoglycoside phosphotransferase family protein [Thermomicrobiales bacterium]|nr:aminoglycoside phosphotransferase family protein [Thermomicrobiales bacterium]